MYENVNNTVTKRKQIAFSLKHSNTGVQMSGPPHTIAGCDVSGQFRDSNAATDTESEIQTGKVSTGKTRQSYTGD